MKTLPWPAVLCAFTMGGYSAQALVVHHSLAIKDGPDPIIRVHHEANENMPPAQMIAVLPGDVWSVTAWYKESVYDLSDTKIGEIIDVVVDHDGKNRAVIVDISGLLGIGKKDVALPFEAVHFKKKDNSWYPVVNTTKDALKSAPGHRYNRDEKIWVPENASDAVGGSGKR
jgi:hypothetical protein